MNDLTIENPTLAVAAPVAEAQRLKVIGKFSLLSAYETPSVFLHFFIILS